MSFEVLVKEYPTAHKVVQDLVKPKECGKIIYKIGIQANSLQLI